MGPDHPRVEVRLKTPLARIHLHWEGVREELTDPTDVDQGVTEALDERSRPGRNALYHPG